LNDWPSAYTPNSGPGDMFFELELSDQRRYSAQEYARRLRAYFKEHYLAVELAVDTGGLLTAALNQGLASPINIQITGSNLQTSGTIAQALASKIQSVPGAVDVRVQERLDYPQIEIDLDRPRIAELGL